MGQGNAGAFLEATQDQTTPRQKSFARRRRPSQPAPSNKAWSWRRVQVDLAKRTTRPRRSSREPLARPFLRENHMTKPDFSDFYKFLASIGIVLIGLSIFLPYILLNGSLDIQVKTSDLTELTPIAQQLIDQRQIIALWLMTNLGRLSGLLAFLGFVISTIGLFYWRKKQTLIDRNDLADTIIAENEASKTIQVAPAQITSKALSEVHFYQKLNIQDTSSASIGTNLMLVKYLSVQQLISEKFSQTTPIASHEVHSNQKIEKTDYEYDIILWSKNRADSKDMIVEMRLLESSPNINWMTETIGKILIATRVYIEKTTRAASSALIIVVPDKILPILKEQNFIQNLNLGIIIEQQIIIQFTSETEIINNNSSNLISLILSEAVINVSKEQEESKKYWEEKPHRKAFDIFKLTLLYGVGLSFLFFLIYLLIQLIKWLLVHPLYAIIGLFIVAIIIIVGAVIFLQRNNPVRGHLIFMDSGSNQVRLQVNLHSGWNTTTISNKHLWRLRESRIRSVKVKKSSRLVMNQKKAIDVTIVDFSGDRRLYTIPQEGIVFYGHDTLISYE